MKLKQWITRISKAFYTRLVSVSLFSIKFKGGVYSGTISFLPTILVNWKPYVINSGFSIEIMWIKWGIGVRFYNER